MEDNKTSASNKKNYKVVGVSKFEIHKNDLDMR